MKKSLAIVTISILWLILFGFYMENRFAHTETMGDLEVTQGKLEAAENMLLDEANYAKKLQRALNETREELSDSEAKLQEVQKELRQSTIIGRVYADQNFNQALDYNDRLVTSTAGFEVVLYRAVHEKGAPASLRVAASTVTDGVYSFAVDQPGEYFVSVSYSENQLYNRRYNHIIHINGGNMIIGTGETVIGPTILLADNGLG